MMVIVQSGFRAEVALSSLGVFLEKKWCISNIISARSFKIIEQPSSENRFSDLENLFCPLIRKMEKENKTLEMAKTPNCGIQAFCP